MACKGLREVPGLHRVTLCGALMFSVAVLAAAAPSSASAQEGQGMHRPGALLDESPQSRPMMLSIFGGLHYGYFGTGLPLAIAGRFYIPLVHEGFIPPVNDEFGIEFGADIDIILSGYNDKTYLGIGIPVDAMWDFHITPNFDAYAKLGLVLSKTFSSYYDFWWTIRSAVGLRLKITEGVYFRAEAGWPAILVGFGFAL